MASSWPSRCTLASWATWLSCARTTPRWWQTCADACLNAQPLPNSQLGQNLAKPGWNCHHDNFKDSNPNVEWKATLEQAEKIGMGTRQYTLKKI